MKRTYAALGVIVLLGFCLSLIGGVWAGLPGESPPPALESVLPSESPAPSPSPSPTPMPTSEPTATPTPTPTPLTLDFTPVVPIETEPLNRDLRAILAQDSRDEVFSMLGLPESYCARYFIFDGGLSVRFAENGAGAAAWDTFTGAPLAVLLDHDYDGDILPGLTVSSSREKIEAKLGAPPFDSDEPQVFGYKLGSVYLFFSGEGKTRQASVVRRTAFAWYMLHELIPLLDLGCPTPDTAELNLLMARWLSICPPPDVWYGANETSPKWRQSRASYLFAGAGLSVHYFEQIDGLDWEETPILTVYGNYAETWDATNPGRDAARFEPSDDPDSQPYMDTQSPFVEWRLDEDLAFEEEKERLLGLRAQEKIAREEGVISPDGKTLVCSVAEQGKTLAVVHLEYLDGRHPPLDVETEPAIDTFCWMDNRYFVFNAYRDFKEFMDTRAVGPFVRTISMSLESGSESFSYRCCPVLCADPTNKTITITKNAAQPDFPDTTFAYDFDGMGIPRILVKDPATFSIYDDGYTPRYQFYLAPGGRLRLIDFHTGRQYETDDVLSASTSWYSLDVDSYESTETYIILRLSHTTIAGMRPDYKEGSLYGITDPTNIFYTIHPSDGLPVITRDGQRLTLTLVS